MLVGGLSVALAAQHTNPITVIGDALAQVNPDIITYRLLRSAFRTNSDLADTAASLRHKVFLALLLAVFLIGGPTAWYAGGFAAPDELTGAVLAPVKAGTFAVVVTTTGELRARKFVQIQGPANAQMATTIPMRRREKFMCGSFRPGV